MNDLFKNNIPTLALVGCGHWGKNLARVFHSLGALHTVCDESETVLSAYKTMYDNVDFTRNIDSILDNPFITQVVLATPMDSHYELAMRALYCGKDVFIEKPMCLSEEQAEELCELSEKKSLILMVGHILLYHEVTQEILKILRNQELGSIEEIYCTRLNEGLNHKKILWDLAPHDLSLISYLFPNYGIKVMSIVQHEPLSFQINLNNDYNSFPVTIKVGRSSGKKQQFLFIKGKQKNLFFDDTQIWAKKLAVYPRDHNSNWLTDLETDVEAIMDGSFNGRCSSYKNGPRNVKENQEDLYVPLVPIEPLKTECSHFLHCCQSRTQPISQGRGALKVIQIISMIEQLFIQTSS